ERAARGLPGRRGAGGGSHPGDGDGRAGVAGLRGQPADAQLRLLLLAPAGHRLDGPGPAGRRVGSTQRRRHGAGLVDGVRFKDRVALVTGGGRGIGAATAELFASEGARVVVSDMDEAPAREVAGPIGGLAIACDVTKRESVESMIERTVKELGRLDVLVTCAGIIRDNLLFKMTDDDWDAVIDTHLK